MYLSGVKKTPNPRIHNIHGPRDGSLSKTGSHVQSKASRPEAMVSLLSLRTIWKFGKHPTTFVAQARYYSKSENAAKPLRILFCGSDEFSVASLRALEEQSRIFPEFIQSIDVLCRPPKAVGRGLKSKQEVPLYHVAKELDLRIHQRDTFEDWNLPVSNGEPINLIVAVSFGLFVPPRLINNAEFGGLNVHPSILPNYRGSAPLQRMIMYGAQRTGITLQTLDTKKFDHGVILAQTRFRIPSPNSITYQKLLDLVTPEAAELLVHGLHNRLYLPPLKDVAKGSYESLLSPARLLRAPKIAKEDREINWHRSDAATRIDRRHRALGPMYSMLYVNEKTQKRFVFHDFEIVDRPIAVKDMTWKWKAGRWFMDRLKEDTFKSNARKTSFVASQTISAAKDGEDVNVDEGPLVDDRKTIGVEEPSQSEKEAFTSWKVLRDTQLAQEIREPPKQNVYHMVSDASSGDQVPIFYIEDGGAIIVAVQGAGLRIREITVEGAKRKPAVEAMKTFRKKGMWKLQLKGSDRWFAQWNQNYVDTFDIQKWKETLPEDRKQEQEDKELWFQIREEKRKEWLLRGPIELLQAAASEDARARAESKMVSKTRMKKVLEEAKEQKRAERIRAEAQAREKALIAEDVKNNDWSYLLLERQRDFFPEAHAEAKEDVLRRSVKAQEEKENDFQDGKDNFTSNFEVTTKQED